MKTLIVILHNIRSTYNVGAILRTCDGFGVGKVIFSGYTPYLGKGLPHEQEKLKKQIHKTALGAEETVKQEFSSNIEKTLEKLKKEEYELIALEQAPNSIGLDKFKSNHTKQALILGEEVYGIEQKLLSTADNIIEIPMHGKKESFNVSVAAGIALWELTKN